MDTQLEIREQSASPMGSSNSYSNIPLLTSPPSITQSISISLREQSPQHNDDENDPSPNAPSTMAIDSDIDVEEATTATIIASSETINIPQLLSLDSSDHDTDDMELELELDDDTNSMYDDDEKIGFPTDHDEETHLANHHLTSSPKLVIETITAPTVYTIAWNIDQASLDFACITNKNASPTHDDQAQQQSDKGILCSSFLKNEETFKLELCLSGWKNSNKDYCAFYLTIPRQNNTAASKDLLCRYSVTLGNTLHHKQSSIRSDFHLGVGFPNFCTDKVLKDNMSENGKLNLHIKIEIFETKSRMKAVENEIYDRYLHEFNARNGHEKTSSNNLLKKMYKDKSFTDVTIKCKTACGKQKTISVHKCVLIHSSMVFAKMMSKSCTFKESRDNLIDLEHSLWSYLIIKSMIRFLYFGQISKDISTNIDLLFELFRIAEYYEITSLITECCRLFIGKLDDQSVCFLVCHLENKYKHVKQIEFIEENNILWRYMVKNIKSIKMTQSYKEIVRHHPSILSTLIHKMTQ